MLRKIIRMSKAAWVSIRKAVKRYYFKPILAAHAKDRNVRQKIRFVLAAFKEAKVFLGSVEKIDRYTKTGILTCIFVRIRSMPPRYSTESIRKFLGFLEEQINPDAIAQGSLDDWRHPVKIFVELPIRVDRISDRYWAGMVEMRSFGRIRSVGWRFCLTSAGKVDVCDIWPSKTGAFASPSYLAELAAFFHAEDWARHEKWDKKEREAVMKAKLEVIYQEAAKARKKRAFLYGTTREVPKILDKPTQEFIKGLEYELPLSAKPKDRQESLSTMFLVRPTRAWLIKEAATLLKKQLIAAVITEEVPKHTPRTKNKASLPRFLQKPWKKVAQMIRIFKIYCKIWKFLIIRSFKMVIRILFSSWF